MATEVKAGTNNREPVPYTEDPWRQPDTLVPAGPLNPCELEIDLFCKGIRLDASCTPGEVGRPQTAALYADQVRKLHRAGTSKAAIAHRLQIGRTSVRRILAASRRRNGHEEDRAFAGDLPN